MLPYYSTRNPRLQARAMILRAATLFGVLCAGYVVMVWGFDVPAADWVLAILGPLLLGIIGRLCHIKGV